METNKRAIDNKIFEKITQYVKAQTSTYEEHIHCYSFELCYNPLAGNHWFLRFIKADISNPDNVYQSYTYFCFNKLGDPLSCSPIFKNQNDSVTFFDSMVVIRQYDII